MVGSTTGGGLVGMSEAGTVAAVTVAADDAADIVAPLAWYPNENEPLGGGPLPPEAVEGAGAIYGASHVDVTSQYVQSNVIVPKVDCATVCPWKTPLLSIVTPEKLIQPVFVPQAQPPSVPPLLVTPPSVGSRLIPPTRCSP